MTPEQIEAEYQRLLELHDRYKDDSPKFFATENAPAMMRLLTVMRSHIAEITAKEGPLNAESWRLDELIAQLEKWRKVASGRTCVSFETLCFGASSLWHQTHRQNYRKVEERPDVLSKWVLEHENVLNADFPKQVLDLLTKLDADNKAMRDEIGRLREDAERTQKALRWMANQDNWRCDEIETLELKRIEHCEEVTNFARYSWGLRPWIFAGYYVDTARRGAP